MRTCPLNSSLFLSWLRLIWMVGEALDVGGGESDRAASYQRADVSLGSNPEFRTRNREVHFALVVSIGRRNTLS
jgi:hypothetical protein